MASLLPLARNAVIGVRAWLSPSRKRARDEADLAELRSWPRGDCAFEANARALLAQRRLLRPINLQRALEAEESFSLIPELIEAFAPFPEGEVLWDALFAPPARKLAMEPQIREEVSAVIAKLPQKAALRALRIMERIQPLSSAMNPFWMRCAHHAGETRDWALARACALHAMRPQTLDRARKHCLKNDAPNGFGHSDAAGVWDLLLGALWAGARRALWQERQQGFDPLATAECRSEQGLEFERYLARLAHLALHGAPEPHAAPWIGSQWEAGLAFRAPASPTWLAWLFARPPSASATAMDMRLDTLEALDSAAKALSVDLSAHWLALCVSVLEPGRAPALEALLARKPELLGRALPKVSARAWAWFPFHPDELPQRLMMEVAGHLPDPAPLWLATLNGAWDSAHLLLEKCEPQLAEALFRAGPKLPQTAFPLDAHFNKMPSAPLFLWQLGALLHAQQLRARTHASSAGKSVPAFDDPAGEPRLPSEQDFLAFATTLLHQMAKLGILSDGAYRWRLGDHPDGARLGEIPASILALEERALLGSGEAELLLPGPARAPQRL